MNAPAFHTHMVSGFDPIRVDIAPQLHLAPLHLAPVGAKAVDLDCDGGRLSSDAGVVLRKDIDDQLGLTRHLAAMLSDPRDARRVNFPCTTCASNACCKWRRAMKRPTTRTPSVTIRSSH